MPAGEGQITANDGFNQEPLISGMIGIRTDSRDTHRHPGRDPRVAGMDTARNIHIPILWPSGLATIEKIDIGISL